MLLEIDIQSAQSDRHILSKKLQAVKNIYSLHSLNGCFV